MTDFSPNPDAADAGVDLFGDPYRPIRDRRGRPCYRKDKENQELVALLVSAGWTQERIARYLGCDEKTLRKYFSRELQDGADLIEADLLQVALKKAKNGHMPSVNRLFDVVDEKGRPAPPNKIAPDPKPEPLGKKAQADRDAHSAHEQTSWGDVLH